MNTLKQLALTASIVALGTVAARADLNYTFTTDVEGFENVTLATPAGWVGGQVIKQNHTAGGWQMLRTKEFAWAPGGGVAVQQTEMQRLANLGNARISFDVLIDGASFPAGAATWFQFAIVGNSDGAKGWTQIENIFTTSSYHNADEATMHRLNIDRSFEDLGWQPGDTWFQFYTGANSEGAVPVNFYLDNVSLYAPVPEPATLSLIGLGIAAFFAARRKQ